MADALVLDVHTREHTSGMNIVLLLGDMLSDNDVDDVRVITPKAQAIPCSTNSAEQGGCPAVPCRSHCYTTAQRFTFVYCESFLDCASYDNLTSARTWQAGQHGQNGQEGHRAA